MSARLSMTEAKQRGLARYFTGKACPHGHVAERMVSTRACTACVSERKRAWSSVNPDKVNAQKRAWRDANLERARAQNLANQKKHRDSANARNQRYADTHREQLKAKNEAWARKNPGLVAAKASRRRAAKLNQTPAWADGVAIRQIYVTAGLLRKQGRDVHVDHVLPLRGKTVCGLHVPDNLQIINANANRMKSNLFSGAL